MEEITKPTQTVMIDPNEPLILPDGTALTGRIEWFLYSLCLLDYENLPTPMSRIEQFANALVTGEVPNIEPQSRVEEYFLAILTGDVENLPEPESRVEVLLNKLARGEFDLSDVEPIQSRYELLIAYLIKNSGIGDITYVLHEFLASDTPYTMYNTKEKPTKSAILKGCTLVNLQQKKTKWSINGGGQNASYRSIEGFPLSKIKPSTKYLIKFNKDISSFVGSVFFVQGIKPTWTIKGDYAIVTTLDALTTSTTGIHIYPKNDILLTEELLADVEVMILEYKEGMENWDIPYFEGMQSVKLPVLTTSNEDGTKTNILTTTSKNLFDMNRPYDVITDSQATVVQDTNQITVSSSAESGIYVNANFILDKDFFAGKTVTGSCLYESDENDIGTVQIAYQDGNGEHHYQWIKTPKTFTFPNSFIGDVMLSVSANNTDTPQSNTVTVKNIQLELGSTATPYEPYSEVVLRGIGDVKDTLDGNTGELTQRIGEVVLDGGENWTLYSDTQINTVSFRLSLMDGAKQPTNDIKYVCDNFKVLSYAEVSMNKDSEWTFYNPNGSAIVFFNILCNKLESNDVNGFKKWLSENPTTIQYPLATPIIKTVDLSILDQDGTTVEKLNTFKDITHVSCSVDEGSIYPYVEMEVATSNDEDLAAIGLKLEEKNKVQSKLVKVNDYQSDVIDNVMLGITEIYESI